MLFSPRNPLVTTSTDKENVSVNKNRAILAISMVKSTVALNKPSILKSVLKKSVSVAQMPSTSSSCVQVKKQSHAPPVIEKKDDKKVVREITVKRANAGQRQFEYAEIQKKRKEELVKKLKEEEEKELKNKFHANPAPKFKKVTIAQKQFSVDDKKVAVRPPQMIKQHSLPQIQLSRKFSKENIVPSCGDPERLKLMKERKQRSLQKYKETQIQFKAKPADVLKKQPFQPVHNIAKPVSTKPFKLHLSQRLLMRSDFDKKLEENNIFRKKQEEVRQRIQDLEYRKITRQKTEFKARANPFGNKH